MTSDYEDWFDRIEEMGRHAFDDPDIDDDLLVEGEEFLDRRSPCRRGHHDWAYGIAYASEEVFDYLRKEEEKSRQFLSCRRCKAVAEIEISPLTEGNFRQNRPHHEYLKHVRDLDEDDIEEKIRGDKVLSFRSEEDILHVAIHLDDDSYMIVEVGDSPTINGLKSGRLSVFGFVGLEECVLIDDGEDWSLLLGDGAMEERMPKEYREILQAYDD